jgi:hypothetical protein
LPVPTDILIYTQEEWDALAQKRPRFFATLGSETVWILDRGPGE